jgi:MarR family transcriptional regulator, organic hydroperoxide resistance regulator
LRTTPRRRGHEPQPPVELSEALEFMRLLWAIDHDLQRRSKRMASRLGMTGPQRLVVRMVGRFPMISAGELAEILHLHPSTLTGILRRLEQKKLLLRRRDPSDGRRAVLELSPIGKRRDVETAGTIEAAMKSALGRLPDAQLQSARRALGALARELQLPPGQAARRGSLPS